MINYRKIKERRQRRHTEIIYYKFSFLICIWKIEKLPVIFVTCCEICGKTYFVALDLFIKNAPRRTFN